MDTVAVVIVFLNFVFQVVFSARNMYSGLYLMDLLTDELPQNKDWIEVALRFLCIKMMPVAVQVAQNVPTIFLKKKNISIQCRFFLCAWLDEIN